MPCDNPGIGVARNGLSVTIEIASLHTSYGASLAILMSQIHVWRTGEERPMSRRRIRALTLILLGLLIAAPLSSGDKGLWLSLISTPAHILSIGADSVPAEHAIVVPERAGRAARSIVAPGSERASTSGGIGVPRAAWSVAWMLHLATVNALGRA